MQTSTTTDIKSHALAAALVYSMSRVSICHRGFGVVAGYRQKLNPWRLPLHMPYCCVDAAQTLDIKARPCQSWISSVCAFEPSRNRSSYHQQLPKPPPSKMRFFAQVSAAVISVQLLWDRRTKNGKCLTHSLCPWRSPASQWSWPLPWARIQVVPKATQTRTSTEATTTAGTVITTRNTT